MTIKLAVAVWPNGKLYFFKENQYYRFDVATWKTDQDARSILGNWTGIWPDGIDAALVWAGQPRGKAYFFRGNQNCRFDIAGEKADEGPLPIAQNWPGLWPEGIDAALAWPTNGKAYFFRGSDYVGFDSVTGKVDGGMRPIAGNWPGIWEDGFDAAFVWPGTTTPEAAYFFKDRNFIRFNIAANKADTDPEPIATYWEGLPF